MSAEVDNNPPVTQPGNRYSQQGGQGTQGYRFGSARNQYPRGQRQVIPQNPTPPPSTKPTLETMTKPAEVEEPKELQITRSAPPAGGQDAASYIKEESKEFGEILLSHLKAADPQLYAKVLEFIKKAKIHDLSFAEAGITNPNTHDWSRTNYTQLTKVSGNDVYICLEAYEVSGASDWLFGCHLLYAFMYAIIPPDDPKRGEKALKFVFAFDNAIPRTPPESGYSDPISQKAMDQIKAILLKQKKIEELNMILAEYRRFRTRNKIDFIRANPTHEDQKKALNEYKAIEEFLQAEISSYEKDAYDRIYGKENQIYKNLDSLAFAIERLKSYFEHFQFPNSSWDQYTESITVMRAYVQLEISPVKRDQFLQSQ